MLNVFRILTEAKKEYEKEFMKQFGKYLDNETYNKNQLHHIVIAIDQKDLEKWVTVLTKKRIDAAKKKEDEAGWFGFFKKKKIEEEKKEDISGEEIEQVYKELYNKFLAGDDGHDMKALANAKSLNIEMVVRKGGLNLQDEGVKVKLYFDNIGFNFAQYNNDSMSIEAQTKNFGLEMKSDQKFEIIEKMDENDVFWEMKYIKNAPGNEIEHSLDLKVNPIKLIYEGSFIRSIVGFFTNDAQLQIQEQAAEKWADFKEETQSQLHESMKAGRKDININISSPILLIPLKPNDASSKLWAINLGNFCLSSENTTESQESYKFNISSAMLKFYGQYDIWEKSAREEILNKKKFLSGRSEEVYIVAPTYHPDNFTLLEDFRIESKLLLNKTSFAQSARGDVEVFVKASPVNFNINNEVYNHLVNIHRCFTYQKPEELADDLIKAKQDVLKKAVLISEVKKRGDNIKTWTKRFAVISNNYVYFYRESKDLIPEYYFFLKDAIMNDKSDKLEEKHSLLIKSKFGSALVSFSSLPIKEAWLWEVAKIVAELSANTEANIEIKENILQEEQKFENLDIFNLQLEGPSVNLRVFEMDQSLWFHAELKTIRAIIKKPVVGFRLHLGIGGGIIKSYEGLGESKIENVIAVSKNLDKISENLVEVEIFLGEKPENPSGDEIRIHVKVGTILINYFPPFIRRLITKVRYLRYIDEYDFNSYIEQRSAEVQQLEDSMLSQIKVSEVEAYKLVKSNKIDEFEFSTHLWDKFPFPYIIINVSLTEIDCNFLHNKYGTPFVKLKVGETTFDYDMYVDHHGIAGSLGGIRLYDMSNYPYTYSPNKPELFKEGKMFEVLGLLDSNEKNTLSFECRIYDEKCPLLPPKTTSTVKIYVSSIKYIFQQDLLFRVKDYFFDQFLDSLSDTDPYAGQVVSNIEEKLIKFATQKEVEKFDLAQPDACIELFCEIKKPWIVLKARNHYTELFSIFLGNITVNSCIESKQGKWKLWPEKDVKYTLFSIDIGTTTFFYKEELLGSIKFRVNFYNLIYSPLLEFVDPLALNKSMIINLDFSPIDVKMSKQQFTYLMKCLDLNINYDDGYKELYDFKNKKDYVDRNPIKEDYKYMVVDIKITSLSMSWYFLGEFLTEIVCHDMAIIIEKWMSFKNIIDMSASALWLFSDKWNETGFKQIIVGPIGWANEVRTDESFYEFDLVDNDYLNWHNFDERKSMTAKIIMHNGDKDISFDLDNLKLFLKLHVFMLLFHFFTEGLPKYDIDDADLPNQCKSFI